MPIHGVPDARPSHPANYTFKLPDNVSFAEGRNGLSCSRSACRPAKAKRSRLGDTAVRWAPDRSAPWSLSPHRRWLRLCHRCRPCSAEARYRRSISGRDPGQYPREEFDRTGQASDGRLGRRCRVRVLRSPKAWEKSNGTAGPAGLPSPSRPAGRPGLLRCLDGVDEVKSASRPSSTLADNAGERVRSRLSHPAVST